MSVRMVVEVTGEGYDSCSKHRREEGSTEIRLLSFQRTEISCDNSGVSHLCGGLQASAPPKIGISLGCLGLMLAPEFSEYAVICFRGKVP